MKKILNEFDRAAFRQDLCALINRYNIENESNTPDFILANYIDFCLRGWELFIAEREKWYGGNLAPARHGSPWKETENE